MKRVILTSLLLISLISFVSAQFYGSYGGGFSIPSLLDSFGPENLTFMVFFIIFFAFIFYALSRIFRNSSGEPNKGIAGSISFAISIIAAYGLYKTGFDLTGFFYGLGIDEGILYLLTSLIFLIGLIFLLWKFKCKALLILGIFLILLSIFTDIFYKEDTLVIIGVILILIWFLCWLVQRWWSSRGSGEGEGVGKPKKIKCWLALLAGLIIGFLGLFLLGILGLIIGLFLIILALWCFFHKKKIPGSPGPKPTPTPNPPGPKPTPKPPKPKPEPSPFPITGEASLDVIAGGELIRKEGRMTLDLRKADTTVIRVKNGGTGGILGWRAACHRELEISRKSGKLRKGMYHDIVVKVRSRSGRKNPGVMISGRGGGRLGGKPTRGRVFIRFEVR